MVVLSNQFKVSFKRLGIEARFVQGDKPEDFEKLIDAKTKAIYIESIGNPKYSIPDFENIAEIAHRNGVPLVVDNTFGADGYILRPLDHVADIVVHSTTKWIGGHGTIISGAIVDSVPWKEHPGNFPQLSQPSEGYQDLVLNEALGNLASLVTLELKF